MVILSNFLSPFLCTGAWKIDRLIHGRLRRLALYVNPPQTLTPRLAAG
ncbi:MAG: hypothetical protein ACYDAA_13100 [Syntrophales bacterium]